MPVQIDALDHEYDRFFVGRQQAIFQPFQPLSEVLAESYFNRQ